MVVAILLGAALSALVSPQFALASGVAFLFSEFASFSVKTHLAQPNGSAATMLAGLLTCGGQPFEGVERWYNKNKIEFWGVP